MRAPRVHNTFYTLPPPLPPPYLSSPVTLKLIPGQKQAHNPDAAVRVRPQPVSPRHVDGREQNCRKWGFFFSFSERFKS